MRKTFEMLALAEAGRRQYSDEDVIERKKQGIYQVAVFGRSVTLVLQNMRTLSREAFDEWYRPYREEMEVDSLFQFFNRLRTEALKEGLAEPRAVSTIYLRGSYDRNQPKDWRPSQRPTETLPGFREGATSWDVKVTKGEDGSYIEEYIPDFTPTRRGFTLYLSDSPVSHLGVELPQDSSFDHLSGLYLRYLSALCEAAALRFGD